VRGGYFSATWPSLCSTVLLLDLNEAPTPPPAFLANPSAPETAAKLLLQPVLQSTTHFSNLEEFRGLQPKNSHGGGGSRTRVRKPSAPRPYVRSPRFGVGRRAGTDPLSSTPSRKDLAAQGPGPPGRPARILTVTPEPTGRDPGDRALGLFKQPARAQRCRWLLCRCLRDLRVSGPLGTRPGASVPPSKPGRPLQHRPH